eukprot:augustus_masked-scaffold_5-processed-gene-10.55-mRNA-1 protein AED:1.00 eAED:1.00 QI:0/-1/0/0/-1/1/1/0/547
MDVLDGFDDPTPRIAVTLSALLIIFFTVYVFYETSKRTTTLSLEDFLTARKTIPTLTIGWSLYASAVGSGALVGPAEFGFFLGAFGVFAYAFATAVPLLMIGFFAPKVHAQYPKLLSLSDFIEFRFGPVTQVFVVILTLLNMSAASIAEYTTLASLYSDYVGLGDFGFLYIIFVSASTLLYTGFAGLRASIVTDRLQALLGLFLVQVLIIYVAAAWDQEELLEEANLTSFPFSESEELTGLTEDGYGSLFTLTFSLVSATVFSEAMWQRGWAAAGTSALRKGSVLGFFLVFILVGTTGTMGFLVRYANIITFDDLDAGFNTNLFLFQIFPNEKGSLIVDSPVGVLVLLLATCLSMGAIDSLQNGIEASLSGAISKWFSESQNLKVARVLLVLINVPLIIVGLQKYSILSVFVLSNTLTVCAMFPLFLGFVKHPVLDMLHRDFIPVTQFLISVVVLLVYASIEYDGLLNGMKFIFWENTLFLWQPFLVGILASIFSTFSIYWGIYAFTVIKARSTISQLGSEAVEVHKEVEPEEVGEGEEDKIVQPSV